MTTKEVYMVSKIIYDPSGGNLERLHSDALLVQSDIKRVLGCLQHGDTLVIQGVNVLGETIDDVVAAADLLGARGIRLYVGVREIDVQDIRALFGRNDAGPALQELAGRPPGHRNNERAEQVYLLRGQGKSLQQIADTLQISKTTVQYYLVNRKRPPSV
jgi:DNA-binding NarL/FixJ family response regulator